MTKRIVFGLIAIAVFSSCVKSLESAGVMKWDLSSLDLPQIDYNGKTYYIHPDVGEMSYNQAIEYCKRLNAYNHQDWFLPDKQELAEMFARAATIGGFQDAAYWYENPYSDNDTDRQLIYGNSAFSSKARVRPVRCENTFSPTLYLRQIIPQNWTTYEIEIPKGSRYEIVKAGIAVIKNGTPSKKFLATGTEGVLRVSINESLSSSEDHHIVAFAELSNGEAVYSNEIIIRPHNPSADMSITQNVGSTSIHIVIDVQDWGFPQLFKYPFSINTNSNRDGIIIPCDEFTLHYETDYSNLNLDNVSTITVSGPIGLSESFSATPTIPSVKTLPATDIISYPYGGITAILQGQVTDVGVPRFIDAGFVYSYSNPIPTIDDEVISRGQYGYNSDYSFSSSYTYSSFSGPFYYRAYIKNYKNNGSWGNMAYNISYGDVFHVVVE